MTAQIANPLMGKNHKNDSENPTVENDKDTIMNYLVQCGLDTSSAQFSIDDVDESSMALLLQLSNQSSTDVNNEENRDGFSCVKSEHTDNDKLFDNMMVKDKKMKSLQKADLKVKSEKKVQMKKEGDSVPIIPPLQVEDNIKIENGRDEVMNSTNLLRNTVSQMANVMENKRMENRDFEQVLAQYSLDSESFAQSSSATNRTNGTKSKLSPFNNASSHNGDDEWQKILFNKMDEQHEHISKCQEQIQSLAKLIAQDMVERRQILETLIQNGNSKNVVSSLTSPSLPSSKDPSMFMQPTINEAATNENTFSRSHTTPSVSTSQQPQPPLAAANLPPGQSFLFTLLEGFFTRLLFFPRQFITYMNSTKIVRLVNLIKEETVKFRQRGELRNGRFIEWTLIMKLCFFCFIIFARFENYDDSIKRTLSSASGKKARKELAALELWQSRRSFGIVFIVVFVYLWKTGLWKLFHQLLVKDNVLLRVWRNEDLNNNNQNENNDNNNNPPRRRGRRDRYNDNNVDENNNENGNAQGPLEPEGQQAQPVQGRLRNIANYVQEQTFLGGQIDHPINRLNNNNNNNNRHPVPREQILLDKAIDGAKDVMYLFGSFFLSLFPMWNPRPREIPEVNGNNDRAENQDAGNENRNEDNNADFENNEDNNENNEDNNDDGNINEQQNEED